MTGIMMQVMNTVSNIPTPMLYLNATSYSGSGTTWPAINGSNATLVNTPTYTSASPTYFSFNAASLEKATIPNIGSISRWTIEAWFRVTSSIASTVTAVITNEGTGATTINFCMGQSRSPTNRNICASFYDGAWRTTNGFAPTLNTWYHCIGTYDGTTIKQYVNGVLDTQLSYTGTPTSGGEVRIASRWDSQVAGDFFPGDIGLTRIWNSALNASQVTTLYNQNAGRFV